MKVGDLSAAHNLCRFWEAPTDSPEIIGPASFQWETEFEIARSFWYFDLPRPFLRILGSSVNIWVR